MYRTHTCGQLRLTDAGQDVTIAGWVQSKRQFGSLIFLDVRDRYGITQVVVDPDSGADMQKIADSLGREFVIQASGAVRERQAKNADRSTGDVEVFAKAITVLNAAKTPPFTIEDESDGGEDIRMQYRYLDLRRGPLQNAIIFRSKMAQAIRSQLSGDGFLEIETPVLIKSTPEGARDFVVPSRMNPGNFYALPQSPQTFKQLLMVSGYDKYFQIVKCFRDEDLRADRQPEFTQIDCEMAFVEQEDILNQFEGLTRHLFSSVLDVELGDFPRMKYDEAMRRFGSDKPDMRFGLEIIDLNAETKGKDFKIFDEAPLVAGICVPGAAGLTRKQLDKLTEWVKRPQIGAKGMVYVKCNDDGTFKSSVDKFYDQEALTAFAKTSDAKPGDLILILSGEVDKVRKQLGELRLEMAKQLDLVKPGDFKPLWVIDFPLLEWDEDGGRFHAMHHPFTSPKPSERHLMDSTDHEVLKNLKADAYDLVINGSEIGGGSIRIHDRALQSRNFDLLGFSKEEAEAQFGFLMGAFEYGAPPHGGIAFGFDRLCAVMQGKTSIRDYIAFPKNNQGRDVMIDAPDVVSEEQLVELNLKLRG
ncbi:MAG: aspartate--tRNA ligase [Saprospiraceae bacterium]